MKKEKRTFFGIAAFALAIVMAACSNPSGSVTPEFSITGKFTDNTGTKYFKAEKNTGGRAVVNQVPLTGTLDDGDITFRLKGFYDAESGAYTLQAASSIIKYSINGTAEGAASASIATRLNANEPFGTPQLVQITTDVTSTELDSNMTSTVEEELVEGFTQEDVWGVWYDMDTTYGQYKYVVNEWGITAMKNTGGEWEEDQTLGFSKIIDNNNNTITVIGDATWAMYEFDSEKQEEFHEYLADEGYELFDEYSTPFPTSELFGHMTFQVMFDGVNQNGAVAVGTNKYLVNMYYDPDGSQYGGTSGNPFVVYKIGQEGVPPIVYYPTNVIKAPTLEDAFVEALNAIRATGDTSVAWATQFPWTYTTVGVTTSLAIADWKEDNPPIVPPANLSPSELDAWDDAHGEEAYQWHVKYNTFLKQKLLQNFASRFPNPSKLILQGTDEYYDLQEKFMKEENAASVTYQTQYYKWNVVPQNGRLIIQLYSTDGDMDNAYADTYAEAEVLSVLVNEDVTLRR